MTHRKHGHLVKNKWKKVDVRTSYIHVEANSQREATEMQQRNLHLTPIELSIRQPSIWTYANTIIEIERIINIIQ